jgi:hypothetical protein
MAASRNTQAGLPVVTVNAYGMAYGAAGLAVIAQSAARQLDPHWHYVVSLLYLSLAGTSLAFGSTGTHQAHWRFASGVYERSVSGHRAHGFDAVRELSMESARDFRACRLDCG